MRSSTSTEAQHRRDRDRRDAVVQQDRPGVVAQAVRRQAVKPAASTARRKTSSAKTSYRVTPLKTAESRRDVPVPPHVLRALAACYGRGRDDRHYPRRVILVAGALFVDPAGRDDYLLDCRTVVQQAREAEGCLDFALSPDLLDPRRINVYERWTDEQALSRFRGSGPSDDQNNAIQDADVQEFRVER